MDWHKTGSPGRQWVNAETIPEAPASPNLDYSGLDYLDFYSGHILVMIIY